jgi:cation diffusion facilitator CzcD-associated flavoprotein CzcO
MVGDRVETEMADAQANGAGPNGPLPERVEIAIIGAGFSGLAMAAGLKRDGRDDFLVLERAGEVGGTWRDNTYPGCRCDVPSLVYSFSFAQNPDWSATFSAQPEIQAYIKRTTAEQGLEPHLRFNCELEGADWDADEGWWRLTTSRGPLAARVLITSAGPLHEPKLPDVPGLDTFEGTVFHSAAWDHDHDLSGERVAVIGTGASAIQFVPQIQPQVERLHLFQRTAPWVFPRRDRRLSGLEQRLYRRLPAAQRAMRAAIYWAREGFAVPMIRVGLAPLLRRIGLRQLRRQVPDPDLREKLTPGYLPGCKRILISNDYLPSLSQPNVEVVCDGLAEVRGRTIVTADGSEREVDTIIMGTGFHVLDMPIAERIRDAGGQSLAERWDGSPQAFNGSVVAGYPNFFFLLGPNTGLGHNSVVVMAEAQVAYIRRALAHMRRSAAATLAVRPEVERAFNAEIQRRMKGTVWTEGGCSSWYIDRNGLNTSIWPDFSCNFERRLRTFDPSEYLLAPAAEEQPREPVAA